MHQSATVEAVSLPAKLLDNDIHANTYPLYFVCESDRDNNLWWTVRGAQREGKRNSATIAPSVRQAVLARDRHRCQSPGCGNTRFLEIHHIVPRKQGGSNQAENLQILCSRCHAFLHTRETRNVVSLDTV